jgi:hypothetical protein
MSKSNNKSSSYPGTTVLPPSPPSHLLVSAHEFPLPDSDEYLLEYYTYIRDYLDRLWDSYVMYCKLVNTPEAGKIFNIIFKEMDFFEVVNGRIIDKMSKSFRMRIRHDYVV